MIVTIIQQGLGLIFFFFFLRVVVVRSAFSRHRDSEEQCRWRESRSNDRADARKPRGEGRRYETQRRTMTISPNGTRCRHAASKHTHALCRAVPCRAREELFLQRDARYIKNTSLRPFLQRGAKATQS